MRKRVLQLSTLTVVTLGAMAFSRGGWAIITVDDLPSTLSVGQPTRIAFTVRQHGMTPLDRLTPTLVATSDVRGSAAINASAVPTGTPGHYAATLVVPRSGDWTVTINSGFNSSRVTLYPIPATATPATMPRAEPSDVGRRLFVAKGCVTCHVHDGVSGNNSINVGPDLTPKRYQADYLTKLLADPSIARTAGTQARMPNLGLKTPEIAALVAFINLDRQATTR